MNFCDACETCAHCLREGCIPVQTPELAAESPEFKAVVEALKQSPVKKWQEACRLPVIDPSLIPPKEAQCP